MVPLLAALITLLPPPFQTISSPKPAEDTAELKRLLASAPKPSDFPNASKATLLDLADIVVRPDGSAKILTRKAIKVLTPLGREQEAEVQLPYNSAYETLRLVRARTIRPDGTVIEVRPNELREGVQGEGYDDARTLSFSMPAVQPGCLIDFQYVTEQKSSALPGHFWTQWYFQGGFDPVQLTRLKVSIPKSLPLQRKLRNSKTEPTITASPDGKAVTYTWEEKDVAPLYTEPFMPPAERLLPKLTLSTVPSWQTVAEWYLRLARDRMQADTMVKAEAKAITASCKTDEEKARAIFYFVQEKTRYVPIELGISAYQPRPASRTLLNQYGDCKDMATLLVALLREVGIKAYPALLEAESPFPQQSELPSPSAFNHAICVAELGDKTYWLDATAQVCPWGTIPLGDRGSEALVIRDGKGTFQTVPQALPQEAASQQKVALTLQADGSATGSVTLSGNGDYEMDLRANLLFRTKDRYRTYLESLMAPIGTNPKIQSYVLSDIQNRDAPTETTVVVSFPAWASVSDDLLIFKARPDQASAAFASPFTEDERSHPIFQARPRRLLSTLELTLPEGYRFLSIPKPKHESSQLGEFRRTVQHEGRKVTITMEVLDHQVLIPATDYAAQRRYLETFRKAYNEVIVAKAEGAAQ